MALHLTLIKCPPAVSAAEDRKSFGPSGGFIGRGASNDWVLSDPERFLSSKHCQISKEGECYYLTDLSTNGTFVNGSQEPLGRGARTALTDGDSFDVGDYRFKVVVERDMDTFPDSPFAEPSPFDHGSDVDLVGAEKADPASMFMSSNYSGSVADITPDAMKVSDPLVALDNANKRSAQDDPFASDPFAGSSQEDSASLLQESVDWPAAKEEGMLPDDWGDDISLLGARSSKALAYTLPDKDALIVKKPALAEPDKAASQISARTDPPRPRPEPNAKPQVAARKHDAGRVDRTLVDAMGFEGVELDDEKIREIHAVVGGMMRETVDGLMQVLRSRTSIKNEFRINITTIQPIENNPLKFSASVDEVLETMFLRQSRAYKEPIESIQESFNSIADHQVAVLAGIRSAFRASLSKFDPTLLEEEFKQSGKGGLVPGVLKGKMWSAYQEHYHSVTNDMERSFQELFGDEFMQAYEDQMQKLSSARKR